MDEPEARALPERSNCKGPLRATVCSHSLAGRRRRLCITARVKLASRARARIRRKPEIPQKLAEACRGRFFRVRATVLGRLNNSRKSLFTYI